MDFGSRASIKLTFIPFNDWAKFRHKLLWGRGYLFLQIQSFGGDGRPLPPI